MKQPTEQRRTKGWWPVWLRDWLGSRQLDGGSEGCKAHRSPIREGLRIVNSIALRLVASCENESVSQLHGKAGGGDLVQGQVHHQRVVGKKSTVWGTAEKMMASPAGGAAVAASTPEDKAADDRMA